MKSQDPSNARLTDHLKALLLGGAIALGAAQNTQAAQTADQPKTNDALDARIQKVREKAQEQNTSFRTGNGPSADGSDVMWWRNAWGNGGWHNWHNGWRNGGGWGNFHNW